MRLSFLLCLCILLNACSKGDSYNRGYVISKSHETAAEEVVTEQPAE